MSEKDKNSKGMNSSDLESVSGGAGYQGTGMTFTTTGESGDGAKIAEELSSKVSGGLRGAHGTFIQKKIDEHYKKVNRGTISNLQITVNADKEIDIKFF